MATGALRRKRLGYTSFAGMGLVVGAAGAASAAEVRPGGALDVSISGFARFFWAYGDLNGRQQFRSPGPMGTRDRPIGSNDFRNETEVHVLLRGTHDATGLDYGGNIEFEADTNRRDNTDETWIFVRGGWGEFRFGDTDSAANTMKLGAYTVAVGTGGIDGTVVELNPAIVVDFNDAVEDNTKIIYYSPSLSGFRLGLSYTPDDNFNEGPNGDDGRAGSGDFLATTEIRPNDVISGGVAYTGLFGDTGINVSAVGTIDPHDANDSWVVYGGGVVSFGALSLGGGVGYRRFDTNNEDLDGTINDETRIVYNLGAAYDFGRFAVSINYGYVESQLGNAEDLRLDDVVLGLEIPLLPGLTLSNELAFLRFDRRFTFDDLTDEHENVEEEERGGLIGVMRLALAF